MAASETLVKLVIATAEVMGAEMSLDGARLMCDDLSRYPEPQVAAALTRVRKELRGRFSLAEVIARIDDGRPGPEEAWGMFPKDEASTAVVTTEMQLAMRAAWPLVQEGDTVAGRMAFKEAYQRIVSEARDKGEPVKWEPSLGHDKGGREAPLLEAVKLGRLSAQRVIGLLPHEAHEQVLIAAGTPPALEDKTTPQTAMVEQVREILKGKTVYG